MHISGQIRTQRDSKELRLGDPLDYIDANGDRFQIQRFAEREDHLLGLHCVDPHVIGASPVPLSNQLRSECVCREGRWTQSSSWCHPHKCNPPLDQGYRNHPSGG